jgi:hypothetical protein
MDEEVEASPVAKRTPWPIGLHSVEEKRKKEEEERERESQQQLQEGQQQQRPDGEEREEGLHNKEKASRSYWSRTGSRSGWNSRGSSDNRVSS